MLDWLSATSFERESGSPVAFACCSWRKYRLTVTQFGREANPVSFVPAITKPALISDHRTPSSGEYVADHWLSAEERKTVRRTPLTAQVAPAKHVGLIRIVLLVLIVFPLAGIGLARLLRARKERGITHL